MFNSRKIHLQVYIVLALALGMLGYAAVEKILRIIG